MKIPKRLIIYGVLVFLLPFLGFPNGMRTVFFAALGILVAFEGYRLRSIFRSDLPVAPESGESSGVPAEHSDSFSQNDYSAESPSPRV